MNYKICITCLSYEVNGIKGLNYQKKYIFGQQTHYNIYFNLFYNGSQTEIFRL